MTQSRGLEEVGFAAVIHRASNVELKFRYDRMKKRSAAEA